MLRTLFEHLAWADANVRDALRAMPAESPERQRALSIYAHLAASEHVWLARLEGRAAAYSVWPDLDLDAAEALAVESAAALQAYVARLSPADLGSQVTYRNSAGQEFRNGVQDVLAHVALHGSYHRGQLALLARQGGGVPASTDYIAYVRGAPAATRVPPAA